MFGVTTSCLTVAREELERLGYEPVVFHATGVGGKSMEGLIESGFLRGVLDVTTTELCDDLVGGVLSAGPDRLETAGRLGVPQVVSVGALDMVNFGARGTVPQQFEERNLYVHNPVVTLMRTTRRGTPSSAGGSHLAPAAWVPALFLPLKGVSMIDVEGQPFHDPEADAALFEELRRVRRPRGAWWSSTWMWTDPEFAHAMVAKLDEYMKEAGPRMTGDEARVQLRATIDSGGVIIGSAGTGLSAKCAEASSTDLIIIYNSGRYRMAGRGSLAGLMPYGDANAIVMDMASECCPW